MFSRVGINLPKGGVTEHTATAFSTGEVQKVIVFGGHNGAYHTNELAILSTDAPGAATSDGWGWEPLTIIGRGPSPRSGHTATPLDDDGSSVLYFGGEYTTVGRKCARPRLRAARTPPIVGQRATSSRCASDAYLLAPRAQVLRDDRRARDFDAHVATSRYCGRRAACARTPRGRIHRRGARARVRRLLLVRRRIFPERHARAPLRAWRVARVGRAGGRGRATRREGTRSYPHRGWATR